MLPGLPPLTAADHEIETSLSGQGPPGKGWTLVGVSAIARVTEAWRDAAVGESLIVTVYHWARRIDGRPLIVSSPDADTLRHELWRTIDEMQDWRAKWGEARAEIAQLTARLELVRKNP